eukprot:GHVH01008098.1.p1 GENE.GHVH01008098.1~~GHVH01008098.1.p1  ORF type:complete len:492 (+),score=71.95 GHVH01008098.1:56-1531(+)
MINKKRVELYMQRKARLHDTHEDALSSDFDMDDCDFKLDGTEDQFQCDLSAVEISAAVSGRDNKKEEDTDLIPLEDLIIPELPDLGLDNLHDKKFLDWKKTKSKEETLNQMNKDELRQSLKQKETTPLEHLLGSDRNVQLRAFKEIPPVVRAIQSNDVGLFVDSWYRRSVLAIEDVTISELPLVVKLALTFRKLAQSGCSVPQLLDKTVISLFFEEPSTRTRCSFQAAAYRLGGQVVVVDNQSTSSAVKGETLSDSLRMLSCYSDAIVVRAKKAGSIQNTVDAVLLNAGDGSGEHPSQALLDVVTIVSEVPDLFDPNSGEDISIAFAGDLRNSRTVRSLALVLAQIPKIKMTFIAPPLFNISDELYHTIGSICVHHPTRIDKLDATVGSCKFIYATRLQKERLDQDQRDFLQGKDFLFKFNIKTLSDIEARPGLRIMHPLPRVGEISQDIDQTDHQLYFHQADNGLYTRMALLALCISKDRNQIKALLSIF